MNSNINADTLPKLLKRNVELFEENKTALREKKYGIWQRYTWRDSYSTVKYFFYGLNCLGFSRGDTLAIIGESKPQVLWSEMAAHAAGGIVTGIFTDCRAEEIKFFVEHSGACIVVAQDQEQVDKLLDVKQQLPMLKKVVYWEDEGLWFYDDPLLISFDKVLELGKAKEVESPGLFERELDKGKGDDVALLLYTSGTTGVPKGAMVSHAGIISYGRTMVENFSQCEKDETVSFAPTAWVGGQGNDIAVPLLAGMTVNYPEKPETVMENIREIAPQVVSFGPTQWEDIARTIQAKISDAHPIKRFFYHLFLPVGYKITDMRMKKVKINMGWRILHKIAHFLVFRPLLDKFGLSNMRAGMSGGTAIGPDVLRLMHSIGVKVVQAYGSSDFGFAAVQRLNDVKWETCGPPAPDMNITITEEGEILVKNNVKWLYGYHKNEEPYKASLIDGWFHSGDFGHFDNDGHLIVMDRMKDLRQLKSGQKFSPQFTEIRLRFSPYIKNALVIGNENHDYVGALINIDIENMSRWAEARRIVFTTFTDLSQKDAVINLIRKEIIKVNALLPDYARIKKFVNLHKQLDADEAELTRTRKIRRTFMEERYRDMTDALYSEKSEIEVEIPVTYRDGRVGVSKGTVKVNRAE